jgi:hypothetical protein
MYNAIIKNAGGEDMVHTFHTPHIGRTFADPLDLYRKQIADVAGYAIDPGALIPRSMNSQPIDKWIDMMVDEYRDDCIDAAQQFAVHCGIDLSHSTTSVKTKAARRRTILADAPPENETE